MTIAHANPADATRHFELAQAAYAAQDFVRASAEFEAAFELDPKSDYLFGWAQSVRRSGDCPGALALYRKLLAMPLAPDQAAATRQAMSRCPPEPVATRPAREPWYRDWTAHTFAASGALALGAGTWATIVSVRDERDARAADEYGEHDRLTRRAKVLRVVGISGLAIGAAAATIGIVMYSREDSDETAPRVTGWIDRDGGGVAAGFAW